MRFLFLLVGQIQHHGGVVGDIRGAAAGRGRADGAQPDPRHEVPAAASRAQCGRGQSAFRAYQDVPDYTGPSSASAL